MFKTCLCFRDSQIHTLELCTIRSSPLQNVHWWYLGASAPDILAFVTRTSRETRCHYTLPLLAIHKSYTSSLPDVTHSESTPIPCYTRVFVYVNKYVIDEYVFITSKQNYINDELLTMLHSVFSRVLTVLMFVCSWPGLCVMVQMNSQLSCTKMCWPFVPAK